MGKKVLIFDTTVLCCLLRIPGKETCGPKEDHWNYERIKDLVDREEKEGSTFVLPLAAIIDSSATSKQTRVTLRGCPVYMLLKRRVCYACAFVTIQYPLKKGLDMKAFV
ncbi:MAG: hypothetical protein HQL64_04590, partial [Magnetococcales bacterium]|nr:hypothetical protein [Magnetococcales bacterium]